MNDMKAAPKADPILLRRRAEKAIEDLAIEERQKTIAAAVERAKQTKDANLIDLVQWIDVLGNAGVHPTIAAQTWQRVKHPYTGQVD